MLFFLVFFSFKGIILFSEFSMCLLVTMMASELKIDPILEKIKRIHPGDRAKLAPFIDKLLATLDSFLEEHPKPDEATLVKFAEELEKIKETSYYVYNELRSKTKFPSVFDRAISLLRWRRLNKRMGGRLPRMK